MTTNYTDDMNQVATYWAPGASDGMGGLLFGAPILIACRWEHRSVMFKNAEGRDVVSSDVVYPDRPLEILGWLVLGDMTAYGQSPRSAPGAQEIEQIGASPDLDLDEVLNKVYL